jgi:hypothetical protein
LFFLESNRQPRFTLERCPSRALAAEMSKGNLPGTPDTLPMQVQVTLGHWVLDVYIRVYEADEGRGYGLHLGTRGSE